MSHKNYDEPIYDGIEEIEEVIDKEVEETEESISVFGVLTDCLKLNIRENPDKDAKVIAVITCLDEVEIDLDESNDDWYAICTVSGIRGFCMKQYIAVKH